MKDQIKIIFLPLLFFVRLFLKIFKILAILILILLLFFFEFAFKDINPFSHFSLAQSKNFLNLYKLIIKIIIPLLFMFTFEVKFFFYN